MRLSTHCERSWSNVLLSVGEGTCLEEDDGFISLPSTTVLVDDVPAMINEVFGDNINPMLFLFFKLYAFILLTSTLVPRCVL